jgi:hypothetical protein
MNFRRIHDNIRKRQAYPLADLISGVIGSLAIAGLIVLTVMTWSDPDVSKTFLAIGLVVLIGGCAVYLRQAVRGLRALLRGANGPGAKS